MRPWERVAKRALDLTGATLGLVLASPVLAAAAVAIKLEDGGPVLFRQGRPGLGGRIFDVYKLRTMHVGEHRGGVDVGDARITRVGALLRATSIDELPQLANVLRGQMSLVGPRPTLAEQVASYTPEQARRMDVMPGLTGWAQVQGRSSIPWSRRIELDVWYVDHQSLALDLRIIARTVGVLARRGQVYRHPGGGFDL